tara:strand:+ start:18016 stop:18762 length:747 start_codon:yes stop_codon:yes gene_type:complete
MIQSNFNKELEEKIQLYINGKLDQEQSDDLWAELIQDDYYLDYMKSVANLKALILEKRVAKSQPRILPLRKYVSYAAAVAVIVMVGVLGVVNYQTQSAIEVSPIAEIGLDVIRDPIGISSAITNEVVKEAIQLASNGNVEEAISLLEKELEVVKSPFTIAELALSLGSIQYNYGDYNAAITNFKKVVNQKDIDVSTQEKGYYFLGNAYFQLDQLDEAEEAFIKAYALDGSYSRIAKRYVDALNNTMLK